jgi:hypothetical protein
MHQCNLNIHRPSNKLCSQVSDNWIIRWYRECKFIRLKGTYHREWCETLHTQVNRIPEHSWVLTAGKLHVVALNVW